MLYIEEGEYRYRLADDAIDYRVVSSPEGSRIAVETMLFSNLLVTRFYRKGEDGLFHRVKPSVATEAWSRFFKESGIVEDEIRYPSIEFLRWESEESAVVKLSAGTKRGRVEKKIVITLP